jgi:hypothetical protein
LAGVDPAGKDKKMQAIETIEYKGFDICIYPDEILESPREWGQSSEIVGYCRDYAIYDTKNPYAGEYGSHKADFKAYLEDERLTLDQVIYLPVSAHIHSGVSLSIGRLSGWDRGQIGYIYEVKDQIRKEFKVSRISKKLEDKIRDRMTHEIKIFNQYITGAVYGYQIEDQDGRELDSLWGFYGYDFEESGLINEAKSQIDNYLEEQRKARQQRVKIMIKHRVPLSARPQFI